MLPDLHRHLDGSLRPSTFVALRRAQGATEDIPRFLPGMGLDAALACFRSTLSVLQRPDAIARVASEMVEDAVDDGVSTLEVRFDPFLHHEAPARIVDAALDGLAGRAGLILCGLYGDPPEQMLRLVELARPGVVAIDLAGGPAPSHRFGLADYAPAFDLARRRGLGRTVHAGEGRPPEEIRVAIEQLHAQRIGHGTTLLHDPAVLDLVRERAVVIEACLTSNVHVGAIPTVADHPLPRWLDADVRVCVNTDNPLLSDVTASSEHAIAARLPGMTPDKLARVIACGHEAAFPR